MNIGGSSPKNSWGLLNMLIVVFVLGVLSVPQAFCIDAVKIKHGNAVRTPSNPWAFCADRSDAVTFTGTADFLDKDGNPDADEPIVNVIWKVQLEGGSGRLRFDKDCDGVDEYYGSSFSTEPAKQGSVTFDIVPPKGQKAYNPGENTLKVTVTNCEDSDDEGSDEDQVVMLKVKNMEVGQIPIANNTDWYEGVSDANKTAVSFEVVPENRADLVQLK